MRYSEQIKSISYLTEVMTKLTESGSLMIITQNGEAKAVIQNIMSYEETPETLTFLNILALGQKQVEAGEMSDINHVIQRLKSKRK